MPRILIKNGKVWDGECFYYADVLVDAGKVFEIAENIDENVDLYGELIEREHIGYVGVDLLTYKGTDKTIKDILAEYGVISCEEYLEVARQHRTKYTAKT